MGEHTPKKKKSGNLSGVSAAKMRDVLVNKGYNRTDVDALKGRALKDRYNKANGANALGVTTKARISRQKHKLN